MCAFINLRLVLVLLIWPLVGCKSTQAPLQLSRFEHRFHTGEGNVEDFALNLKGFTNADYAFERSGIYLTEKYDPNRTPVLFIHGLLSDPQTWRDMTVALKKDPVIRDRFQFWYYAYPSGTPTVPSAAFLKKDLDKVVKKIEREYGRPMDRKLVVIGHSMGGILAKSLVSNTGDKLWDTAFRAPVEDFDLTPEQRQLLLAAFRYKPRNYVGKVIFIAAPHRGSGMADGFNGGLATLLSSRPEPVEKLIKALTKKNKRLLQPEFYEFIDSKVNSVSTLRSDSIVTNLLADLPIDPEIEFHSISGIKDRRNQKGDGIVPLESTFIPNAYCEVGVFSGHSVHKTKEAFDLVDLILKMDFRLIDEAQVVKRLSLLDLAYTRYRGVTRE